MTSQFDDDDNYTYEDWKRDQVPVEQPWWSEPMKYTTYGVEFLLVAFLVLASIGACARMFQ